MAEHTIWKFVLRPLAVQQIEIPQGARLLTVQLQGGSPMLWALVDQSAELVWRSISLLGTGQKLGGNIDAPYLGTVQMGELVWHFFDGGESL